MKEKVCSVHLSSSSYRQQYERLYIVLVPAPALAPIAARLIVAGTACARGC